MTSFPHVLSFGKLTQGRNNHTVRVTCDHLISAVDLAMVITGIYQLICICYVFLIFELTDSSRGYAERTIELIDESVFGSDKFITQSTTKLLTLSDAMEFVMVLPAQMAAETRKQYCKVIEHYMTTPEDLKRKRTQEELGMMQVDPRMSTSEDVKRKRALEELEIEERTERVIMMRIESITKFINALASIDPNWQQDANLKRKTLDLLLNARFKDHTKRQDGHFNVM